MSSPHAAANDQPALPARSTSEVDLGCGTHARLPCPTPRAIRAPRRSGLRTGSHRRESPSSRTCRPARRRTGSTLGSSRSAPGGTTDHRKPRHQPLDGRIANRREDVAVVPRSASSARTRASPEGATRRIAPSTSTVVDVGGVAPYADVVDIDPHARKHGVPDDDMRHTRSSTTGERSRRTIPT